MGAYLIRPVCRVYGVPYSPARGSMLDGTAAVVVVAPEEVLDEPFALFSVGGPVVPVTSFNAAMTSGWNVPVMPDAVKREE